MVGEIVVLERLIGRTQYTKTYIPCIAPGLSYPLPSRQTVPENKNREDELQTVCCIH